jgi:hypothetical protein
MASQRTLSILKPDATRRNITGKVNAAIEAAGRGRKPNPRKATSGAKLTTSPGRHVGRGLPKPDRTSSTTSRLPTAAADLARIRT